MAKNSASGIFLNFEISCLKKCPPKKVCDLYRGLAWNFATNVTTTTLHRPSTSPECCDKYNFWEASCSLASLLYVLLSRIYLIQGNISFN